MNKYEQEARKLKSEGNNCSNSVYKALKNTYELKCDVPAPRSIDGKCGTVLTTEAILKEKGRKDLIPAFEEEFVNKFGYLTCVELMRHERRCNDYVGFATEYITRVLGE